MKKNKIDFQELMSRPDSQLIDSTINIVVILLFTYLYFFLDININWLILFILIWILIVFAAAFLRIFLDKLGIGIIGNIIILYLILLLLGLNTAYNISTKYFFKKNLQVQKKYMASHIYKNNLPTGIYLIKFRKPIYINYNKKYQLVNGFFFEIKDRNDIKYLKILIKKPGIIYGFKNIDLDEEEVEKLKKYIKKSLLIRYEYAKNN